VELEAISVSSSSSSLPQLIQTNDPRAIWYTVMASHFTQATVGSDASGKRTGGVNPDSVLPVKCVAGSNVLPQLLQT
jgi:hypothetical protein